MNKNILSRMIFGAVLLLFTACTQDELTEQGNTLPEGMYPLEISSVTLSAEADSQPWGADGPQTRVSESEKDRNSSKWDGNETIYVRLDNTDEIGEFKINKIDEDITVTPANTVYWAKRKAKVTAWYPTNGEIRLDEQKDGNLAYVLQAVVTDAPYDAPVTLNFFHQLAKIRVVFTGGNASKVTDVKIESYITCTNKQGTVTTNDAKTGEIAMYKTSSDGTDCWEANVVPSYPIKKIKVNKNANWSELNDPIDNLMAGKYHVITVRVKPTEVDLGKLTSTYTIDQDGEYILTGSTTQRVIINANATVTLKGVTINTSNGGAPIQIRGYHTATLMLEGENNLTAPQFYSAILPDAGSTVEIDGAGSMKAQGGEHGAGIGASNDKDHTWGGMRNNAGIVKILGGNIEAIGGFAATGIGCSYWGSCQGIEISGGTVTAKAGTGYTIPAIGSSTASGYNCEYVKLERCTINAYSRFSGETDPVVANSVTPDVNNSGALNAAKVTLKEYDAG